MKLFRRPWLRLTAGLGGVVLFLWGLAVAQEPAKPAAAEAGFDSVMAKMKAAKADNMKKNQTLLGESYGLADKPSMSVKMSRGKAGQEGVRVKVPKGTSWEKLAEMTPEEIRDKDLFPAGFLPLPHPNHPEGGMLFPK